MSRLLALGRSRRAWVVLWLAAGLGYAWFLTAWGTSVASSSDASGYFNAARLFSDGRTIDDVRVIPGLNPPGWNYYYQQPLGFRALPADGRMAPTYPIGMPLMLVAAAQLVGWDHAAVLVNVLGALGCGALLIAFGREHCGLRPGWLTLGVVLLGLGPLFVFFTLQPMSDMPATFWVLLTLYAAARRPNALGWGLLAGAAAGMAVLVRPTNALLVVPLLILLGWRWQSWLACIAGGLPFAAALALYNHHVYGAVFTTGYGDVSGLLGPQFLAHNTAHFARWIPTLLTPFVVLALGAPYGFRLGRRAAQALSAWCLCLVGFYAFYFHSGETWWYLRFILPAFPALLLLALMTGQRLSDRIEIAWLRAALPAALLAIAIPVLMASNRQLGVLGIRSVESNYHRGIAWLEQNVPADAVMAAMQMSGTLHFYTPHALIRYDLTPPESFARALAAARAPRFFPLKSSA
ncbi:MAG: hypothetical protein ACO3DQ_06700 [Cephaloticoccus sp.]